MDCCNKALAATFNEDLARRDAQRYRRRGLPARALKVVTAIESAAPLDGLSTLEVGVGAGGVTVEMLRRGAAHATGVDASAAMLAAAQELAADLGFSARTEFVNADFAEHASLVEAADVVVLDRVVCCYPDWSSLLSAAAVRARKVLVMSYPRDNWFFRIEGKVFNLVMRLFGREFRYFVHPAADMQRLLNTYNLTPRVVKHHFMWEILVAEHR